jgi:serine/threonine protein phosphatase PrpC
MSVSPWFRVFRRGTSAPGLAMSRSLGDLEAERVGVVPDADGYSVQLQRGDQLLLIASDGLWEVGCVATEHASLIGHTLIYAVQHPDLPAISPPDLT